MKSPECSTVFTGVDAKTRTSLPTWFESQLKHEEVVSFTEAIRDLPQATETTVAYKNPYTEEWVQTGRHHAIVEPKRILKQATGNDAEDIDPLFSIPTDSYTVINPVDVYSPLEDVLRSETYEDTPLSELVFGEIRQYRGGGEVHMDIIE